MALFFKNIKNSTENCIFIALSTTDLKILNTAKLVQKKYCSHEEEQMIKSIQHILISHLILVISLHFQTTWLSKVILLHCTKTEKISLLHRPPMFSVWTGVGVFNFLRYSLFQSFRLPYCGCRMVCIHSKVCWVIEGLRSINLSTGKTLNSHYPMTQMRHRWPNVPVKWLYPHNIIQMYVVGEEGTAERERNFCSIV